MTGDGVNDAPSLKKADTGIAVEGASDAARSAADIVFLAPGLSAIIDALKVCKSNYALFSDKLTNNFSIRLLARFSTACTHTSCTELRCLFTWSSSWACGL